jgi:hypothetical protein
MKLRRNPIISNRTFSWWAAWLKVRNDGIVVSLKVWVRDPVVIADESYPPNWYAM